MDKDLKNLEAKLAQFKAAKKPVSRDSTAEAQNMNIGIRAGTEFIVDTIAGIAIGWGLDKWLGIKPWGLIVFLFLGVGAGFMAIYRITNNAGSAVGFASLQKGKEAAIKRTENASADDDADD